MTRTAGCGVGCLALVLVAALGWRFGLVCLLVPCDRGVSVAAAPTTPAGEPLGGCEVALEPAGSGSRRVRTHRLVDGEAGFVIGPWKSRYNARVTCPGQGASPPVVVDFRGADRIDLGRVVVTPGIH